jgi:hypothetical protein
VVSHSVNDTFWRHNFRNYDVKTLRVADAILQHCCCVSITGILQRRSASLFGTEIETLNFTRLDHTVCYVRRVFEYFCVMLLTAHCTNRQIPLFPFVTFRVSSPVITDHYTCCYVTWTVVLHNEIILLLKEVNRGVLKFELSLTIKISCHRIVF